MIQFNFLILPFGMKKCFLFGCLVGAFFFFFFILPPQMAIQIPVV
jgi:hypothetical protein